jgi:hypothetical protein
MGKKAVGDVRLIGRASFLMGPRNSSHDHMHIVPQSPQSLARARITRWKFRRSSPTHDLSQDARANMGKLVALVVAGEPDPLGHVPSPPYDEIEHLWGRRAVARCLVPQHASQRHALCFTSRVASEPEIGVAHFGCVIPKGVDMGQRFNPFVFGQLGDPAFCKQSAEQKEN